MKKLNSNFKDINSFEGDFISRYDPVMIDIVKELGEEANDSCASIVIKYVDKKFIDFISIDEYDGMELITYDLSGYKLFNISKIVNSLDTNDEKIAKIKVFFE